MGKAAMKAQGFNIVIIGQNGRLQYEAVIFAASLRHSDPDFKGRLFVAEPQPGDKWSKDPRMGDDVRALLLAGADKGSFNSAAVANPDVIADAANHFGSQCIVVAIDAKTVAPGKWEIFTHGGRKATGIDAVEFAKLVVSKGAGEILLTSMDRDGTKRGFNLPLTRAISDAVPVPVIASGGVGNLDHLVEGVTEGGASAVLAASIFHFGTYTIGQAKQHMSEAGIPMRLT